MVQTTRGGSSDFLECVVYKMLSRFFFIFEFGLKGEEVSGRSDFTTELLESMRKH